jgi:biopolymer transport protein ExbD
VKYGTLCCVALVLMAVQPVAARDTLQRAKVIFDSAGKCHVRVAEKDVVVEGDSSIDGLGLDPRHPVRLIADQSIPYVCVGTVIYALQKRGGYKVGFIAAPPSVH